MKGLQDKVALVTGGSSGIGQAIAIRLVEADVSDEQAVTLMYDRVMSEYGRLDILVNNAGIQIAEDSDELSAAAFDKVLAVNLRGAFLCARQAVRSFLAADQPGVIVNVSSVHQVIPKPRFLGYSVSKGGMQSPHPVARAGVRCARHPGQRHRAGRDRHAD